MEIKDLLTLMWRGARYIVIGFLLGTAVGLAGAKIQAPVYEATTKILVSQSRQQSNADALPLNIDQLVTTYLQLVKTQPVLDGVSSQLGIKIDADNIQVAAISNTQIIQIKVQDGDSQRAAAIANALFQVLVQQNETLQAGRYKTYEDALNTQITQVENQISDLQAQVDQINKDNVQAQLTQVTQEIEQLSGEITGLELEIANFPTVLSGVQRTSLVQKQAQLEQLRSLLTIYLQIQTNLTIIGSAGQSGTQRDDPRVTSLQSTLSLYQQLHLSLLDNLETVRLARMQNMPNVTQLDPAVPPKDPIRPLPLLYVMLGGIVGLAFSASLLLMLDHMDDSLRTVRQTEELLDLPVLGSLSDGDPAQGRLVSSHDPSSMETETFRDLAVSIELIAVDNKVRTLLVTNIGSGESKTTIAANLAIMNARQGKRVILLEGDLRHPHLHDLFEIENKVGVSDLLKDNTDLKGVIHFVDDANFVTVIPSGVTPKSPTRWLDTDRLTRLFLKLQTQADLVIVDGPSVEVADTLTLASIVDAVLLVIRLGNTRIDSVQAALKRFQLIGARVIGAVLNRAPHYRMINWRVLSRINTKQHTGKDSYVANKEVDKVPISPP